MPVRTIDITITVPDSFDDDDVEIVGAGLRPPTDPTLADTDGDSLSDFVETNTGTYSSPTNTGSGIITSPSPTKIPPCSRIARIERTKC